MTTLDSDIERLNSDYSHLVDNIVFKTKWKELKERLESMNKDIIVKKQIKFGRDKSALTEGLAYRWFGRSQGRRGSSRANTTTNSITDIESDSSLSSTLSSQSTSHPNTLPTSNSSRKRLRFGGNTPPTNSKKDKKGPKGSRSSRAPPTQTPNDTTTSLEGAVGHSTLHGTIPKVLSSVLMTNKYTKINEDAIFLDLKKQQSNLDTYVLKPSQPQQNTPHVTPTSMS